jgi:hypothetical protein
MGWVYVAQVGNSGGVLEHANELSGFMKGGKSVSRCANGDF